MREIDKIILHHSLTKDSETVSWGAIRRYHVQERGWRDIGYHFGIELVGDFYEIFVGRSIKTPGAHTKGQNLTSIGICFVGNFDIIAPPLPQVERGIYLVKSLLEEFNLGPLDVYGHRNFASKSCPGTQFDMNKFHNLLRVS